MATKVYWHYWAPWPENDHPLLKDGVFIDPVKYIDTEDFTKYRFYKCPAWKSWASNTWVFYSQLDWDVTIKDNGNDTYGTVVNSNQDQFNEFCHHTEIEIIEGREAIIQINPSVLMWTDNKKVWLEQIQHPSHEIVSAHFRLGTWKRNLSCAFRTAHLKIKRGDPMFMIRFSGVGENYQLIKRKPERKVVLEVFQNLKLKDYLPGKAWGIMNRESTGKCPFNFG